MNVVEEIEDIADVAILANDLGFLILCVFLFENLLNEIRFIVVIPLID